jgi:hypothetical protein
MTWLYHQIIRMIYFCAFETCLMWSAPKTYNAVQRLTINGALIIEGLRDILDLASSLWCGDTKDLDFLTAPFGQSRNAFYMRYPWNY